MAYVFPYLIGAISLVGVLKSGYWTFLGFIFVFALHPILDFAFENSRPKIPTGFLKVYIQSLVYLIYPFLVFVLFAGLRQYADAQSLLEKIGIVLSIGVTLGLVGLPGSHELVHRAKSWEKMIGVMTLSLVNFAHFKIFHVDHHHKYVGTPKDPATAKKNQNLYAYWLHGFFAEYKLAWQISIHKDGLSPLKNEMFSFLYLQIFSAVVIAVVFGAALVPIWILISVIAILLLQTVDYLEHYGLVRKELKPEIFEAIKPKHSWDAYSTLTNVALFNLGFHSNHHTKSQLVFTELKENNEAKHLPYGYSVMFLCAMIPPLWFKVMNPLIDAE